MNGIDMFATAGKLIVAAAVLLLPMTSKAGSLDQPQVGSGMPTTADIYNRLTTGVAVTAPAAFFQGPGSGPTAGSGRTLTEIQSKLPAADNTNGAAAGDVSLGKTFWGLRTDGTWGVKSGTMAQQTLNPASPVMPAGHYAATNLATVDTDLVPGNIKSGVTIFGVSGSVIQSTGDAPVFNVVSNSTFSNATASGLLGTMPYPYRGTLSLTPGTTAQLFAAGYYNGSGTVAGDADLASANIRSGTSVFGVSGSFAAGALAKRVPKTGKSTCWAGSAVSDCAGTGQDGEFQYGINPPLIPSTGITGAYTVPAWTGTRFTNNGDGTVTDNLTALIWMRDARCTDTLGGVFKPNGPLGWSQALVWIRFLQSNTCHLSDGSSAGQWRLPNINELHSLAQAATSALFSGLLTTPYWSSSNDIGIIYITDVADGIVDTALMASSSQYNVLAVRGGQ